MLWRTTLILILGLPCGLAWAQEGTLNDLVSNQHNDLVEVRSLPVHPWFGSGTGRDWDAMLSQVFDQIIVKDGEALAAVEGARVSDLFLAYLDDQISSPEPAEEVSPEVKAALDREAEVKAEIADVQKKIETASGSERVKLRRQLDKLQQELITLSRVTSEVSPGDGSFFADLRDKAKDFLLSNGGLRLDVKPLLGSYAVTSDWKTVKLEGTSCYPLVPNDGSEAKKLDSLTALADVTRLTVNRKWASTVFGTKKEFSFNTAAADHANLAGLAGKSGFRIEAVYLARTIELRGAISLNDLNLLAAESPVQELSVGCSQVSFSKGLGFSGLSSFPISLASGLAVNFPQVVAVELSPLPVVKFSD